jgi:hypothetical protein
VAHKATPYSSMGLPYVVQIRFAASRLTFLNACLCKSSLLISVCVFASLAAVILVHLRSFCMMKPRYLYSLHSVIGSVYVTRLMASGLVSAQALLSLW